MLESNALAPPGARVFVFAAILSNRLLAWLPDSCRVACPMLALPVVSLTCPVACDSYYRSCDRLGMSVVGLWVILARFAGC